MYIESGLSTTEFTQKNNISRTKFYYWLSKYKEEKNNISEFIPIKIKNKAVVESSAIGEQKQLSEILRIEFPNGINIIFNEMPNNNTLSTIISKMVS